MVNFSLISGCKRRWRYRVAMAKRKGWSSATRLACQLLQLLATCWWAVVQEGFEVVPSRHGNANNQNGESLLNTRAAATDRPH